MMRRIAFIPATTVSQSLRHRKIPRLDRRRHTRVAGLDAHEAAALRPQLAHRSHESGKSMQHRAGGVGTEDQEMDLYVGRRQSRSCAQKRPGIAGPDRQQSFA